MPANPAAETPTIVIGESLTRIFWPITSGLARKPAHPVVVAEHDDGVALVDLIVLLRIEHAPDRRLDPEHREVVPGDQLGLEPLGAVVDADRGRDQPAAQDFGQRLGSLLVVLVDRDRSASGDPMLLPLWEPCW